MDDPISFESWIHGARAIVETLIRFDVDFEDGEHPRWSAQGGSASVRLDPGSQPHVPVVIAFAAAILPCAPRNWHEERFPCTRDGSREAGERIAHLLGGSIV